MKCPLDISSCKYTISSGFSCPPPFLIFKKYSFIYLALPGLSWGMWGISSWTKDGTQAPCFGSAESQWTTRELPGFSCSSCLQFFSCLFLKWTSSVSKVNENSILLLHLLPCSWCLLSKCFLFFFLSLYYLFYFFWLHGIFVALLGLSPVAGSRGSFSLRCVGFWLWWLLVAEHSSRHAWASVVAAHRLSSCGLRAWFKWASVLGVRGLSCSAAC